MLRCLLLLFFFSSLFAEEEIVVHLAHAERLDTLMLHPIEGDGSFSADYLKALHKVLAFDLSHCGKFELVEKRSDFELKTRIENKHLTLFLSSQNRGIHKGIEKIPLKGMLDQDRRVLHTLADALQETIFGTPGVCSTRILYTVRTRNGSNSSEWVTEVWESDYDGANAHQVTFHRNLCVTPIYIPKEGRCQQLLYVCYQIGQPKIFATSVDKNEPIRLTYMRGNQLMPALSPKGDMIAFVCDVTGNPDLFVQDFSSTTGVIGKPRQIFSSPHAAQGSPTFSPDGKEIAFVSNKDGTPRIYTLTIPAAGTSIKEVKPRLISKKNRDNTSPVWSPDGKKIAYSALNGGSRQIWIYDFTTGEETQLTDGFGHKENPTWGPDSMHLLFNSSTPTTSELFLINLKQKQAIKITSGPGEKRFPAWETLTKRII